MEGVLKHRTSCLALALQPTTSTAWRRCLHPPSGTGDDKMLRILGKILNQVVERKISLPDAPAESLLRREVTLHGMAELINREVNDPPSLLAAVESQYGAQAIVIEKLDGLGMEFADWRFNLRMSNTEPVVRLNVESRGDEALMAEKTEELLSLIDA